MSQTVMRDQEAICEMLLTFGACPLSKDRVNIPLHYVLREKKKKLAGFMIKSLKKQAAKPASEIDIDWKDATGGFFVTSLISGCTLTPLSCPLG